MSRSAIWLAALMLALLCLVGFRELRPDLFEQYMRNISLRDFTSVQSLITSELGYWIAGLFLLCCFLIFSNFLHVLFYRPKKNVKINAEPEDHYPKVGLSEVDTQLGERYRKLKHKD